MSELPDAVVQKYLRGEVEVRDLAKLTPQAITQLKRRTQMFLDGGHDERALVMLEMLEELDRKDAMVVLAAVDVLVRLGRSGDAAAKVERLLAVAPKSYEGRVAKARVEVATGAWPAAAATLASLLKEDPRAATEAGKRAHALAREAHALFEASR